MMVSWSPDGSTLAYSEMEMTDSGPGEMALKLIDLGSGDTRTLADGAAYAAWSPDGKWIASSIRDGNSPDGAIWILEVDGKERRKLTPGEKHDMAPTWSPDGESIVYSSGDRSDIDLFIINTSGGEPRHLTENDYRDFSPEWSPDGKRIVFYREKGDQKDQIHVINRDGSSDRRVTDGTTHNFYPSFVPDGRIAFTLSDQEAGNRLVSVNADGSEPSELEIPGVNYARWSPDGSTVAIVAGKFPGTAIYLADADGSNIRKVVN